MLLEWLCALDGAGGAMLDVGAMGEGIMRWGGEEKDMFNRLNISRERVVMLAGVLVVGGSRRFGGLEAG